MKDLLEARIEHFDEICAIDQEVIGDFSRRDYLRTAINEKRCIIQQTEKVLRVFSFYK